MWPPLQRLAHDTRTQFAGAHPRALPGFEAAAAAAAGGGEAASSSSAASAPLGHTFDAFKGGALGPGAQVGVQRFCLAGLAAPGFQHQLAGHPRCTCLAVLAASQVGQLDAAPCCGHASLLSPPQHTILRPRTHRTLNQKMWGTGVLEDPRIEKAEIACWSKSSSTRYCATFPCLSSRERRANRLVGVG